MATLIEPDSFPVSAVYDFSAAGPGTFTFDPIPRFRVIGTNNTIETSTARSVSITVIDVSKHELLDREIHEPVIDCNGDKKKEKILRDAYWGARDMANVAILNIQHHDRDDPLYKQAFGSNNPVDVVANFITLVSPDGPHRLGCYESDKNGFYEYDGQDKKIIWFYDRFFDLPKDNYLCVKTDLSQPRITLGGTMMVALGPTQGFHADENKMGCVALGKSLDPEKFTSAANYAVSTQTPRCLPRARMLTGVMAFVVLRRHDLRILYVLWEMQPKRVLRISEEGGGVSGGVCAYR